MDEQSRQEYLTEKQVAAITAEVKRVNEGACDLLELDNVAVALRK